MKLKTITSLLALAALSTQLPNAHAQGSLTPPAGAPAPVMKSLDQIEPRAVISTANTPGTSNTLFRITQPGGYYLVGNISVPAGFHGIEIATNDVTLDLNGFSIIGQSNSLNGVVVKAVFNRLTVRNGSVSGMGASGVNLFYVNAGSCQDALEAMTISHCGQTGAVLPNSRVRNCMFHKNASGLTIFNGGGAVVENCVASENTSNGLYVERGIVSHCYVNNTTATIGNIGIFVSDGGVHDCVVRNYTYGVSASGASVHRCNVRETTSAALTISDHCFVAENILINSGTGTGITCYGTGNRIERNNITHHTTGIRADAGANNLIVGNSFRGCTTALNTAAGNRVGPLLTGTSSPAINGNTGGGLGTTDPNANLIY